MNIAPATNLLVRLAVDDDPEQVRIASAILRKARLVAVPIPSLCEFVWVLMRGYRTSAAEVAGAIRRLVEVGNVRVDRPAVEAGLAILEAGGDFADGAIAFDGARLGGTTFVSFDREAVRFVRKAGGQALLPTPDDR